MNEIIKGIKACIFIVLLLFRSPVFSGTIIPENGACSSHELLSNQESIELLKMIPAMGQADLVRKYDFLPKRRFKHNNAEIILSKKFYYAVQGKKRKELALAFIKIDDKLYPRVVYRSGSHGTYRIIDGMSSKYYSKGPGQEFVSIPFSVAKFLLGDCLGYAKDRTGKELVDFLNLSDDHLYYHKHRNRRENLKLFYINVTNALLEAELPFSSDAQGRYLRHPKDIQVRLGFEPDYSEVTAQFKAKTTTAGLVDTYIYRSKNKLVDYMIMKDEKNKIWVADINTYAGNLNRFGIVDKPFFFGDLTKPRWDYHQEISVDFKSSLKNPYRSHYGSNWNYLREIRVIQDWYKVNNKELPVKEKTVSIDNKK